MRNFSRKNSVVRIVRVTHDGRAIRTREAMNVTRATFTKSCAGLSELSVEQNVKRFFGEALVDFHERIRILRDETRKMTENQERFA